MNRLLLLLLSGGLEALRELEFYDVFFGARPVPGTDQNDQYAELDEVNSASKEVVENINHS